MLIKKRKREDADINGSSMADIAFLLLIFFLVTTTINVDTGIGLVLPPPLDPTVEPPPIKERNLMNVLVNAQGIILMDEEQVSLNEVKQTIKDFIQNPNNSPELSESPQSAIVSLKTVQATPYRIYIDMLDEVVGAYRELRNELSIANYGVPFGALEENSDQQEAITDQIPKRISISEPSEDQ